MYFVVYDKPFHFIRLRWSDGEGWTDGMMGNTARINSTAVKPGCAKKGLWVRTRCSFWSSWPPVLRFAQLLIQREETLERPRKSDSRFDLATSVLDWNASSWKLTGARRVQRFKPKLPGCCHIQCV